jgi:hypothetical protein
MIPFEFIQLTSIGIPIGLVLLMIFSEQKYTQQRYKMAKWCIFFGLLSTAYFFGNYYFNMEFGHSKQSIIMIYIGLPSLSIGLTLYVAELIKALIK